MNVKALNQWIARIVVSKNIATREMVQACGREIRPDRNLGEILVTRGVLTPAQYQQILHYVRQQPDVADSPPQSNPATSAPQGRAQTAPAPSQESSQSRLQNQAQATHAPSQESSQSRLQNRVQTPSGSPASASPSYSAQRGEGTAPRLSIDEKRRKRVFEKSSDQLPAQFRENEGKEEKAIQPPRRPGPEHNLDELLIYTRGAKASDLHLSPGRPIMLRRFGRLEPYSDESLSDKDIERIIRSGLANEIYQELEISGDLELAYSIPGHGRYRMTFCEQRYGYALTARVIDREVRPFEDSGLPESCRGLTQWAQGMVLVTGPLGCGKSSTLSTLVELVNQDRPEHIITIENPIEVIYQAKQCQITQREVGRHTLSPANALRGALRQDPDILVVSELRDLETIRLAVSAAETGHLVFATMNTNNATRTINRLIDAFPPEEQGIMRIMISESLRGVISQQLIPRKDGQGLVPAYEVLVVNRAIANMIRKDSTHQVESAMVSGRAHGMVLLDESLKGLVEKDIIEGHEAFFRASNPKVFKQHAPSELQAMFTGDAA